MEQSSKEQTRIDQQRKETAARYPQLWADMIAEWNSPGSEDRAWLMYSANYLFRTGEIRWAMDPLTLRQRVPDAPAVDIGNALDQLDFVLMTHRHADHLDFNLMRAMRNLPIRWVIPDYILPQVLTETGLPTDQVIAPHPLQPIEIKGIRILPFVGLHWEAAASGGGTQHGVPEMGYLVEFNGKRWLFPGDTRTYQAGSLPSFGQVDGLFAHVWLGRGGAMLDEPPLLAEFCRFCVDLKPKRVVLTHLEEFGRQAEDYWDASHAQKVMSHFRQYAPQVQISPAYLGENVIL